MATNELQTQETNACATTGNEKKEERPVFLPRVDIWEANDTLHITAEMPGVDEKNTEITVEKDVLTLKGHVVPQTPEGLSLHYREYMVGDYERSFTLGQEIDRDRIEASIKNGVLHITLPKAEAAKPKQIAVKAS